MKFQREYYTKICTKSGGGIGENRKSAVFFLFLYFCRFVSNLSKPVGTGYDTLYRCPTVRLLDFALLYSFRFTLQPKLLF